MTRRALMVTPGWTAQDDWSQGPVKAVRPTPADTWARGLGALLDRVGATFDGAGVLVLDAAAARALKLPTGPDDRVSVGVDDARAAGWQAGTVGAWTTFYGEGRPTITVAVTSWGPEMDRCPLISPAHVDSVARLALWHELTGDTWTGTPGVAGLKLFRHTVGSYPAGGRRMKPTFKLPEESDVPDGYELDYSPRYFAREQTTRYAHGYDVTRMYLAAAQSCEQLAVWSLKPGTRKFDPKRAGWWLVELGTWNDERMPAPAGYGNKSRRWLTTPTVALLDQLQRSGGAFQPFEIIESRTAPGHRILRPWAETLEGAYQAARGRALRAGDDYGARGDAEAVRLAVKAAYREGWGLLNRPGSAVYRPDWHFAILAHARRLLWQKLWNIGQAEGRWPSSVNVDQVWYGSNDPDPVTAKPAGVALENAAGLTDALGTFKTKGTREVTL